VFTLLKLGLALLKAEFIATKIAFMSNPIGLAIGILILAAGLIITYWEPIKTFFAGVWGKIKSIFFGVVNWMKSFWSSLGPGIKNGLATIGTVLFPFMGMPVLIIKNWSKIKGLFSGLWDFIKSVWKPVADFFSDLWDKVKDSFLHPIDELKQKWQSFKDFFTGIWETIKHPLGGPTLPTLNYPAPTFPTMGTHQLSFVGVGSPAIPDFQIPPAKASNTTTINAPITINAHPGMDAHAVAKEVDRKFRERESQAAARNRGALHD
jgi:hypothetical protein